MSESICIQCRNSLQQKKPKMPDQACANGLKLHDIPQELDSITPPKHRLVAKCIPFLDYPIDEKIWRTLQSQWTMCKCTKTIRLCAKMFTPNAEWVTTASSEVEMQVWIQSHYMYHVIWKDRVIGAITWLKQRNPHYADIIANDEWYSSITNSELTTLVREYAVHQERSHLTVINTNTQTHDPDLDDEEQTHGQQSTDDILNIEGNKAIVIENTKNNDEESDNELQEEQAAPDHKQELTGDALSTVVQIENLENQVYQCAPGENSIPKYILLDEDFEVLAFSDFFLYGEGGYYSEWSTKLPIQKYFQQHLLNVDICFAQNMEYLFCTQYISDIKQIQGDTYLAICLSCRRTLDGHKITAGMLQNPTALQQLVQMEQAYTFWKNIRRSPAHWQHELYDILAILHSLGIHTWFLTLSAVDLHWPEMMQAVALQLGRRLPRDDVQKMSIAQRSTYLWQNPNTGVCMFQHRLRSFFSQYLLEWWTSSWSHNRLCDQNRVSD